MAYMTTTFLIKEDEEPMATEPIYLSSDESEYSTPNTTPNHHDEGIYIDSNNQLIASQLEQRSNTDTETVFYPPTPNTCLISDTEEQSNLTPIFGDPEQYTSPISQRRKQTNTNLPTCATYPRHARITTFGRSRSDRCSPSL